MGLNAREVDSGEPVIHLSTKKAVSLGSSLTFGSVLFLGSLIRSTDSVAYSRDDYLGQSAWINAGEPRPLNGYLLRVCNFAIFMSLSENPSSLKISFVNVFYYIQKLERILVGRFLEEIFKHWDLVSLNKFISVYKHF